MKILVKSALAMVFFGVSMLSAQAAGIVPKECKEKYAAAIAAGEIGEDMLLGSYAAEKCNLGGKSSEAKKKYEDVKSKAKENTDSEATTDLIKKKTKAAKKAVVKKVNKLL